MSEKSFSNKKSVLGWICRMFVTIYRHRYTVPRAIERTVTYVAFHALLGL